MSISESPQQVSKPTARPFVIRDPVHGYLVVAAHERIIVDHALTQRLRRITQTGLAEYVFPEARTSRFVHSLGAMHLASRFVLAAIENADEDVATHFFEDIDSRIPKFGGAREKFRDLLQQEGTLSALATVRASFRHPKLREERILANMAIVEAALRLAALFHDLGHLPFSHDVEYALKDFATQQTVHGRGVPEGLLAIAGEDAPHEEIGHRLSDLVFKTLTRDTSPAVQAAFELASSILNAKNPIYDLRKRPHASPLQWLHSLVDGEIDADRGDYLLRDGQALGLDFSHYDVDRLVSNLVLVRDPDLGFVSAVKEPGLAALESYCLSRSRSHQVFVRHHKVAQIATALRHCSVDALGHITFKPMLDALESLGRNDPDSLTSYAIFDDTWWFQSLRVFRRTSSNLLTNACLDLVLDRQRTLRSVWKRKGDLTPEQRERINSKVDGLFTSADGPIALAQKRRQLLDEGILIAPFKFNPLTRRKPDRESVMLIKSANGTVPASTVSPLIAHLRDSWEQDIHLYAFVLQDNSATLNEIVSKILN